MIPIVGVYLIHYEQGLFCKPTSNSQHYMGCSNDIPSRINEHLTGKGARFPTVMYEKEINGVLARTWETDTHKEAYQLERRLKGQKNGRKLCLICTPNKGD
jgi:predicted GIY-YIG superfamily endonuclease